MKNKNGLLILAALFLVACKATGIAGPETLASAPVAARTSTDADVTTKNLPSPTATMMPPTATIFPTANPTPMATGTPTFTIQPVIHDQPGELYETLFSLPVGGDSIIQYFQGVGRGGPSSLAVLPDGNFVIADPVGDRLLHYDRTGDLLKIIVGADLGVKAVSSIRTRGSELFLLEKSYQNYWIHQLSLDGVLIASEKIPHQFPISRDFTIENNLAGIAIDCEGNIILEVEGANELYHLADVQTKEDPDEVTDGYFCNSKRYYVINPSLGEIAKLVAGDITYETQLTFKLGGLRILEVFQGGAIYVSRNDVVTDPKITVDLTVHYIGSDGNEQGMARVPLSEFYYPTGRSIAIGPDGEAYVLLPRPDSINIVRLNFYKELAPLVPDAVVPHIIRK